MRTKADIEQTLSEMETRRKSYTLDMIEYVPQGAKYNTDLIRQIETTDTVIRTLKWVMQNTPKTKKVKP